MYHVRCPGGDEEGGRVESRHIHARCTHAQTYEIFFALWWLKYHAFPVFWAHAVNIYTPQAAVGEEPNLENIFRSQWSNGLEFFFSSENCTLFCHLIGKILTKYRRLSSIRDNVRYFVGIFHPTPVHLLHRRAAEGTTCTLRFKYLPVSRGDEALTEALLLTD